MDAATSIPVEIAECGLALKLLRSRKRRLHNALDISTWPLQVALCIVGLSEYKFTLAVQWLLSRTRRGRLLDEEHTQADVTRFLEEAFLSSDTCDMAWWLDPEGTPFQRSALRTAERYVRDAFLAAEVHRSNAASGVA